MPKHRKFNAHRFLDKLRQHVPILRAFAGLWPKCRETLPEGFGVEDFTSFLAERDTDGKEELIEQLHRVYDLCTEVGHEWLLDACRQFSYDPEPDGEHHVEALALKTFVEKKAAFDLAYDMYFTLTAERFSLYRGVAGQNIADPATAALTLGTHLGSAFKESKRSDRVVVRQFSDGARLNFVIYHEKRRKAHLTFKGGAKTSTTVAPLIFRPVQQDLICYDSVSGTAEIETGFAAEEEILRRGFAACCLGDSQLLETEASINQVDLDPVKSTSFEPRVSPGHTAYIVELQAKLGNDKGPTFALKSKNVLRTLNIYGLYPMLGDAIVRRIAVRFYFGDDKRGLRVDVATPNSLRFKRAKHADNVFGYLRQWGVLRG